MPRHIGWARVRRFALLGSESFDSYLHGIDSLSPQWNAQETSGSVLGAWNTAVALGRNVALLTYGDYTAGAGWSNSGGQVALHTAGSVATFQQDGILAAGKTFQAKITISLTTAGSVTITDGGAAISGNGQATRTITSTGADFIITPTTDFDGSIDVAVTLVQQTNILASSRYPGAELLPNNYFLNWSGVPLDDVPDGWSAVVNTPPNSYVTQISNGMRLFSDGTVVVVSVFPLGTLGKRYRAIVDIDALTGVTQSVIGSTTKSMVLGNNIYEQIMDGVTPRYQLKRGAPTNSEISFASLTEANPLNLTNTGLAVGQPGAGNIPFVYTGDGTTGRLFFASIAEYNSIINFAAGGLIASVSASTWAAGVDVFHHSGVDATNFIEMRRSAAVLEVEYQVGGVGSVASFDTSTLPNGSPSELFNFDCRWTAPGTIDILQNGVEKDSTAIAAAIIGNLDPALTAWFAANSSGGNSWAGSGAGLGLSTIAQDDLFYLDKHLRSGL